MSLSFTRLVPTLEPARSNVSRVASLLALLVSASCVPVTRYEEARSAAQVEMEGRRRAEHRVTEVEYERDRLRAELEGRDGALRQRDEAIDESKLASGVLAKERDQAAELVEQLRGELARVGEHMRTFSEQKRELEQALGSGKGAERSARSARVARDLTLLLHEPIASGALGLDLRDGELTLTVADPNQLDEAGLSGPQGAALVRAVARIAELYPEAKIELRERGAASAEPVVGRSARLEPLIKALNARGLADRLLLPAPLPEGEPPAPREIELEIRFLLG
jgi:hypothetical protein